MCDPGSLALAAASTAAQGVGMIYQINEQNRYSERNAASARQGAAWQQDQEMEAYANENRTLLQSAMDRVLQARSATELAYTSAFENGAGGGVLGDMMRERSAIEARNMYRDIDQRKMLTTQTNRRLDGYRQQAQGRIAEVPKTSLNLGHIMQLGSNFAAMRAG